MCFSIPCKILKIKDDIVIVEGGKVVKIGKELKVKEGDFLQVSGNIGVGVLPKNEGFKIRKLIKSLNN